MIFLCLSGLKGTDMVFLFLGQIEPLQIRGDVNPKGMRLGFIEFSKHFT